MVKNEWGLIDHGTLKLGVSHKWFDELSSTEWYLYTESDGYPLKLLKFADLDWNCLVGSQQSDCQIF